MKSSERLRRSIITAGGLIIAAFVGSAVYDSWRLHQQVTTANARELGNLANALAAQAANTLQAVDVLLVDTANWYQTSAAELAPDDVQHALAQRAVSVPEVSVLTVVDAQGQQRVRSRATGEPFANVADRPYFEVQRAGDGAGMYINPPLITRTEGVPGLVISRRLNDRNGVFAGVVTAVVSLKRLQAMYMAIHPGERSAMLLTLNDGTLVIRQPAIAGLATKYPELAALNKGLLNRTVSSMDGNSKLVAAVGVGTRPLILAVTRDEEEALLPWYDEAWSGAIRTVLLALLVVVTSGALLRQLRRLERGEQALRQSEERYAMAMEAANEGHAEWNIVQNRAFASDKWCTLHGLDLNAPVVTPADFIARITVHPDDKPTVKDAVENHLAGRTQALEVEYRVLDGHPNTAAEDGWRWLHVRGRCLRDGQGAPRRLFCAATDVTARRRAEAAKNAMGVRMQQTHRLEALGTLAGGIAHDFNNILAAILGFGEMAQQNAPDGSAQRRHIDRVLQAGARARMLVRRILDFSRSGVAERTRVDLKALVEEATSMLIPALPTGIQTRMQLPADPALVMGDATQLYQVVINLCTNALQAMGESGILGLRLEHVRVTNARSLAQGDLAPGPYLRLDVSDDGMGMAPDVLQRMFDPFFTTKEVGEGTGLGLSVVHGIVTDLGGAIDVVSDDGREHEPADIITGQNIDQAVGRERGTCISLWLPEAVGAPAPERPGKTADLPRGNGEVVMVVDDEQPLVELAEELLAGLGYEPVGFGSSESALEAFEAHPQRFDAVLSDEMLPGMTGSELAARLRATRPRLPILLMSGRVDAALEQRALTVGVTALLHKPLTLQELAESLANLIGANAGH
ncbi:MAG: response regulator [Variovorax sp.]|nr:MAG: response regulator [Variovorax sp.]